MASRVAASRRLRSSGKRHHRLGALPVSADGAEYVGPPTELNESDRIEWIPLSEIRGMIDRREIVSSASLLGLMYTLLDMSPDRAQRRPSPTSSLIRVR
jgi:hypothetical protein